MDILKVFNLVVCNNTPSNKMTIGPDIFGLLVAPLNILMPTTRFAILAYITILIYFILIHSSKSTVIKKITTQKNGSPSWINSLLSALLLYIFQTFVILLFLKFSVCDKTVDWENNDYQVTLQQYNPNNDGY